MFRHKGQLREVHQRLKAIHSACSPSLSRRPHAAIQLARRADCRGAPVVGELQEPQGGTRGDLRAQPQPARSQTRPRKARQEHRPRRAQSSFGEGRSPRKLPARSGRSTPMRLADEGIATAAYKALQAPSLEPHARAARLFRGSGRAAAILKHARNWSYAVLEREVRATIYRKFAASALPTKRLTPRPWANGACGGTRVMLKEMTERTS